MMEFLTLSLFRWNGKVVIVYFGVNINWERGIMKEIKLFLFVIGVSQCWRPWEELLSSGMGFCRTVFISMEKLKGGLEG